MFITYYQGKLKMLFKVKIRTISKSNRIWSLFVRSIIRQQVHRNHRRYKAIVVQRRTLLQISSDIHVSHQQLQNCLWSHKCVFMFCFWLWVKSCQFPNPGFVQQYGERKVSLEPQASRNMLKCILVLGQIKLKGWYDTSVFWEINRENRTQWILKSNNISSVFLPKSALPPNLFITLVPSF